MQGFDREKAEQFMLPKLDVKEFKPLAAKKEKLLSCAIDADMKYMKSAGVLDENGMMGNAYYDDDDAFEFILEEMIRTTGVKEKEQDALASFIDQYMDLQQAYLEDCGMLTWD